MKKIAEKCVYIEVANVGISEPELTSVRTINKMAKFLPAAVSDKRECARLGMHASAKARARAS